MCVLEEKGRKTQNNKLTGKRPFEKELSEKRKSRILNEEGAKNERGIPRKA